MKEIEELKLHGLIKELRCTNSIYYKSTDYEILEALIRSQIFLNKELADIDD